MKSAAVVVAAVPEVSHHWPGHRWLGRRLVQLEAAPESLAGHPLLRMSTA